MNAEAPLLFFDYVDPLSYLLERELSGLLPELAVAPLCRVPLELRPPPGPMLDPESEEWTERWSASCALAADRDLHLRDPAIVPWTRKAHELVLHADSEGLGDGAHRALFDAFFLEGRDIGRVDVLVEIARSLGEDQSYGSVWFVLAHGLLRREEQRRTGDGAILGQLIRFHIRYWLG